MKCFLFAFVLTVVQAADSSESTELYFQMPEVYKFEDFDKCFGVYESSAVYCVVNSFIKPDPSSELYEHIKSYSSKTKQHLRHDKLQRGICLNNCKKIIQGLDKESQKYFADEFPMDSKLIFDFIKYPNAEFDRLAYNEIINKCVNVELMDNYNLSAFSTVEYCKHHEVGQPLDALETFTAVILCSIALAVILSSLFDRFLRISSFDSPRHYHTKLSSGTLRFLTIFSIKRNWYILSAPVKENVKDLRFIEALRTLIMFGVIHNHCAMYGIILPSANPAFIDDAFSTSKLVTYMSGNPAVQTFMVIGGFLTAYLFMTRMEKDKSSNAELFFRGIVGRYVRFAPLLALTILLHSTWLYRLGDGPFWDRVNYTERQFCRENWWTNLLFLDNYINVEHKCLIHSWYLAADFWLKILATLCLIKVYRTPTSNLRVFGGIFGLSAIVFGYTIYANNLEAISVFPPENIRNQLLQASDDEPNYFKILYAPTHLNVGNYFCGVVAGLFYHRHMNSSTKVSLDVKLWHRVVFYVCLVVAFFNIFSNYFFYEFEFKTPSIFNSLTAIGLKHLWGVVMAVMMLGLTQKVGWFVPKIMNHEFFKFMGRISYATFMCHLFVVKLLMSSVHQPLYLSDMNILVYALAAYTLSSLMGFFLTLCFEIPVGTICNMLNLKKGL